MGRRISYLLSAAAALVVVGGVAYVPAAPAAAASGRGTTAQVAYQRMQCSSTTGPDVCTSTVHVANADGTSNSVVATYSETESSTPGGTPSGQRIDGPLVWSPDGTELVTDASGNTVVVTTAGQTVFSGHTGFVTWSWSPDSREVAGEDLKAGGGSYLGILDVKTGVMNVVAANGADPAWSPDSDAIAYVDTATGDLVSTEDLVLKVLVTKTVLSSAIAAVDRTCPQPNATISSPAWSPDGRQVAFTATYCASPGGATAPVRIGVVDIAGGRLSLSPCCMHIPQWSPDGSVISAQPYVTWQPSTGQVTNMAFHQPAGSDFIPPTGYPWTPDATGLVYPSYPGAPGDSNDYSLRLIGADGTGDHAIPGVFTNGVFALSPSSIARRYGGVLRTDTAVAVAQATWSSANAVVIARDDLYPDGLVGGPLAAKVGGPILLTPPDSLPLAVCNEISALGATTAYVMGDTGAVSDGVTQELSSSCGVTNVKREQGPTRFDTAAAAAEEVGGRSVYITEGSDPDPTRGWPDAVAVSGLASYQQRPLLLTTTDSLPAGSIAALRQLGATQATIVGGSDVVSDHVDAELRDMGIATTRVSGPDRYSTSAAVATLAARSGMSASQPWLATGENWPDALSAGPAVAHAGGDLLLVGGNSLADSAASQSWLSQQGTAITSMTEVGGPDVLSPLDQVQALRIAGE